jgi:hypothetical protein
MENYIITHLLFKKKIPDSVAIEDLPKNMV